MMRYISPREHKLAQKYQLGTPTRKYRLGAARSFSSPTLFSLVQTLSAMFLGLLAVCGGLYVAISTTIAYNVGWMWFGLVGAAAFPIAFGCAMQILGKRRLVLFNSVAALLSFFLVMAFHSIFFARLPQNAPLSYLLSGLFLLLVGLSVLWVGYHTLATPSSVLICTDGCLVINRVRRTRAVRWEQVSAIWNSKLSARVVCTDGTRFSIYYQWPNGVVVRDLIYTKTLRHIRSRALVAYETGEQVSFGKYRLSQQGINNGTQNFPWERVRECEYIEDAVALTCMDGTCLDQISLKSLPNAGIFVSLVNSIVGARVRGR
jgi:hypothetical protein